MFDSINVAPTRRVYGLGGENLLIFGVLALLVGGALALRYWFTAPAPREALITKLGTEIQSVERQSVPSRSGTSHISLEVVMRDGEIWFYNDYQPNYLEAMGLLRDKSREVVLRAYPDATGLTRTPKGLRTVRALCELEIAGRRVVDYDVLTRSDLESAKQGLIVGVVVCPLVAVVCLGGYALARRQA